MENTTGRRNFIKHTAMSGIGLLGIPSIVSASFRETGLSRVRLTSGAVVLFQGDSITDMHRKRDDFHANSAAALGEGYPFVTASDLLYDYPKKNLVIYNRGVSGNKVFQLADRWDADCLALKPDVVSILVGVNDFWHTITHHYTGTVQTYREDYIRLLSRTKEKLPGVQLIVGEPYALKGVKVVDDSWYPVFDGYRAAAREIAGRFGAVFIPYQSIYDKALKLAPATYWSVDGVHPTVAGARLMSDAWLHAIGA